MQHRDTWFWSTVIFIIKKNRRAIYKSNRAFAIYGDRLLSAPFCLALSILVRNIWLSSFLRSTQRGLLRGLYDTIVLLHFCQVHVSSYPLFLFSLFSFFLGRFHLMNKLLHDYCFYLPYVYFETENLSLSFLYFVEMRIYSIVQIYPLSGLGRKVWMHT